MFGWHGLTEIIKLTSNCSPLLNCCNPFWPTLPLLYPPFDPEDSGSTITICCNCRLPQTGGTLSLYGWHEAISIGANMATINIKTKRDGTFIWCSLSPNLCFYFNMNKDRCFLSPSAPPPFCGTGNVLTLLEQGWPFHFMCQAIIAHSKVPRPAALHSSVVKFESCCWPKATCPHTHPVYLFEGCDIHHSNSGNALNTVYSYSHPVWLYGDLACLNLLTFSIYSIIHSCRICIAYAYMHIFYGCLLEQLHFPASVLFSLN